MKAGEAQGHAASAPVEHAIDFRSRRSSWMVLARLGDARSSQMVPTRNPQTYLMAYRSRQRERLQWADSHLSNIRFMTPEEHDTLDRRRDHSVAHSYGPHRHAWQASASRYRRRVQSVRAAWCSSDLIIAILYHNTFITAQFALRG